MNTSRIPQDDGERPQTSAREWLQAIHAQFQNIANQSETEVIASYQAADLLLQTSHDWETIERSKCVKQAALARMHALIVRTSDEVDRRRLRKTFFRVTGDWTLKRFLFFW